MVNWTNDERARDAQGHLSRSRMLVLEALEAQGYDGATMEDVVGLVGEEIGGKRPTGAIGQSIARLIGDGYVIEQRGRWYLKECAPESHKNGSNSSAAANGATNGYKPPIAPYTAKRSGKTIALYTTPRVFQDVIALHLRIGGRWFPIMFEGCVRICYGIEAPQWSPEQVIYSDVEVIKFTHKDGGVYEEHPAPKDLVTIAPE